MRKVAVLMVVVMAGVFGGQSGPAVIGTTQVEAPRVDLRYAFGMRGGGGGAVTQVKGEDVYAVEKGYGFDLGSRVEVGEFGSGGYARGKDGKAFFFSAKLAPGAYHVDVMLGGMEGASETTVKSETRRLMLEGVKVGAGKVERRSFLVHVRVPQIPGVAGPAGTVAMKPREKDLNQLFVQWDEKTQVTFLELDWDEKLTLAFSGEKAAVSALEIRNAEKPITVYLIGDSTVTDQMMEPWGAWGQQLPRWFREPVLIANYAESGETTASFIGERRWPKVMTEIHAGDYVLMQFGINDRSLPIDRFKGYFVQFIEDTKKHGATPVLVTSQNLRRLDANGKGVNTLGGYPEAMRQVAAEQKVTLIDLNAMSEKLYEGIGAANLPKAFVDGTHQNMYGSYELAKCVVKGIIEAKLPWAEYVVEDWKGFDPAKPDRLEDFRLPVDPQLDPKRPGAAAATAATTRVN